MMAWLDNEMDSQGEQGLWELGLVRPQLLQ
jgi:hypothetical protein